MPSKHSRGRCVHLFVCLFVREREDDDERFSFLSLSMIFTDLRFSFLLRMMITTTAAAVPRPTKVAAPVRRRSGWKRRSNENSGTAATTAAWAEVVTVTTAMMARTAITTTGGIQEAKANRARWVSASSSSPAPGRCGNTKDRAGV